jgi:hypothetical protein
MFTLNPETFETGIPNDGFSAPPEIADPVVVAFMVAYPLRRVETVIVALCPATNPETVSGKFEPETPPFVIVPAEVVTL